MKELNQLSEVNVIGECGPALAAKVRGPAALSAIWQKTAAGDYARLHRSGR